MVWFLVCLWLHVAVAECFCWLHFGLVGFWFWIQTSSLGAACAFSSLVVFRGLGNLVFWVSCGFTLRVYFLSGAFLSVFGYLYCCGEFVGCKFGLRVTDVGRGGWHSWCVAGCWEFLGWFSFVDLWDMRV